MTSGHKYSALKQQNKKHYTLGHKSKRQISRLSKGRIEHVAISKKNRNLAAREVRRKHANEIRKQRREDVKNKKRQLGAGNAPPFLITILPLSESVDPQILMGALETCDSAAEITQSPTGITHISSPRLKQKFSFLIPSMTDLISILDATKISDTVVLIWDANEEDVSASAEILFSALKSQGWPTIVHTISGTEDLAQKKKQRCMKTILSNISRYFPGENKVNSFQNHEEAILLLRKIGSQKQKSLFYRDRRPHMMAEELVFENKESTSEGDLKVYGYLKGEPLSANALVHMPGCGDFQIAKIESCEDPHPLNKTSRRVKEVDMSDILDIPSAERQESLDSMRHVNVEELNFSNINEMDTLCLPKHKIESKESKKVVPKGTSEYQAHWISDDEEETTDDDLEYENMILPVEKACSEVADEEFDINSNDIDDMSIDEDYDSKIDLKEEMNAIDRMQAVQDNMKFPDEVELPMEEQARVRFRKYRGLESFRTSKWDEGADFIPVDFSRIYRLNVRYEHARKTIFKEHPDGVEPGKYIVVTVCNFPIYLYEEHLKNKGPLVLFGMLPLEQKMSIMNVALHSNPIGHYSSIKSKEKLIFHVGYRRFANCPIFSEHSTGDKHKFLRYFHPGETVVASFFAPIMFSPCPVTVFKQRPDGSQDLIATGTIYNVDPERTICKRAILTGHPYKVNRRSAVIRFMFFNREDIEYFKPILLKTKYGRKGKIIEPLGTHGHMKCSFNGILRSDDTVMLNLYKRIFPKLTYDPYVPRFFSVFGYQSIRKMDVIDNTPDEVECNPPRKRVRFVNDVTNGE